MNIEMQTGLEKSYADEMIALVNEQGGSEASEAYIRGYEDGYDQARIDLIDDDLGSSLEEEGENCGECFGASFNDCDECRGLVPDPDCQWT
jgi:hypothetical protein